jgi:Icc-related predicted phosphoesterase
MLLKIALETSRRLALCATLLAATGCNLIEFSPNDHRVPDEFTDLTQKNLARLLARPLPAGDTLRFIFTGDSQRFYDEAEDLVSAVNKEPGISFVLVAGDISDFSLAREMKWVDQQLRKLGVPYVTVVGNHDLNGNGRPTYQHIYGALDYSFVFGDTKFTLIDTNSREYNFNGSIPSMSRLGAELRNVEGARRQIVVMHVPPDNEDFDPALTQPFTQALAQTPNLVCAMNGHNHAYRIGQPFGDGVTYVNSDAFSERHYLVVTVWGDKEFRIKRVAF